MGFTFSYQNQLLGQWETAKGFLVKQITDIVSQLTPLGPMQENLPTVYPANSVMVTDSAGKPAWQTILPKGLSFNASTTGLARLDGSQVIPNAYNTQAVSTPTPNTNQLAHSFFVNSNVDIVGSSSQCIEGYNYYTGTGTTPIVMCNIGNGEHGGTGTITSLRSMQGGTVITSSGGGSDAVCFFASPGGRAFGGTGTFTNGYGLQVSSFGAGYTNKYAVYSADSTAGIFLASDVAVKATTNTWQVASDARLKRDVRPYTDGLDVINAFRPVHFTYNGKGDTRDGDQGVGLIAQEAQTVAPAIVKTRNASDGETYLTLDSGDVTWMLVNAVQELSARVQALEAARDAVQGEQR